MQDNNNLAKDVHEKPILTNKDKISLIYTEKG